MKKLILLLFSILLCSFNNFNGQTLLSPNGGFEEADVDAHEVSPYFLGSSSGQVTYTVIDSVKHSGNKCLLIDVAQEPTGNWWDIQVVYENIPTTAATYYRASFWARSNSNIPLRAVIGNYDYTELSARTVNLSKNWTLVTLACFNEDKEKLRVQASQFKVGQYFIDDLSFTDKPVGLPLVVPTGDSIIIVAVKDLATIPNTVKLESFSVKVNGVDNPVKSIVNLTDKKTFALILTNKILLGDKVSISHDGDEISYADPTGLPDETIIAFLDSAYNTSTVIVDNINNAKSLAIEISPNPAKDFILIKNCSNVKEINIYSIDGALVKRIVSPSNKLDISNLLPGTYFVNAISNNGYIYEPKKLIKLQ